MWKAIDGRSGEKKKKNLWPEAENIWPSSASKWSASQTGSVFVCVCVCPCLVAFTGNKRAHGLVARLSLRAGKVIRTLLHLGFEWSGRQRASTGVGRAGVRNLQSNSITLSGPDWKWSGSVSNLVPLVSHNSLFSPANLIRDQSRCYWDEEFSPDKRSISGSYSGLSTAASL